VRIGARDLKRGKDGTYNVKKREVWGLWDGGLDSDERETGQMRFLHACTT